MDFVHQTWKIRKLIELYSADGLELSPGYQRNIIWSSHAQKELLESVFRRRPMPSFFLRKLENDKYEMVDGQQRARTLIGFYRGQIDTYDGQFFAGLQTAQPEAVEKFLNYELSVTIITLLESEEHIEKFYSLINSTGLRLNRPEIRKADFYTTRLLRLVTTIAGLHDFQSLNLFTRLSAARMNDIDFASELIAQLEFGITDKKDRVDELYKEDISETRYEELRQEFLRILGLIKSAEHILPLSKTRYRQKNDFYTLFGLFHQHPEVTAQTWEFFYRILIKIGPYIRPSQDRCEPLKLYALNCVTQSNSKKAREERLAFLVNLLMNRTQAPSDVQRALLSFFRLNETNLKIVSGFLSIDPDSIHDPDQHEIPFEEDDEV
jgi:hypothetical protein